MGHEAHLFEIPYYAMVPFILMLGSIAVLPLVANEFWESNKNKLIISLVLGVPTAIWLLVNGMTIHLEHAMIFDYVPFLILLGALFVITGGIFVDGDIASKPKVNMIILAIGGILASLMGTTGAAMLLIRPLIKTNEKRKYKVHTILFFIAIVANCGGLLTPLGDPPLFMMYLRGAPFEWFAGMWAEWLFVNIALLVIYYIWDTMKYKKEAAEDIVPIENPKPISIKGNLNFLWLLGVVAAVAFINPATFDWIKAATLSSFTREGVIVLMAVLSLAFTTKKVRESNKFEWEPIGEVAFLFLGIFATMVPVLIYLETHAASFGFNSEILFYYATGGLSAFLDNTPTAVTFHALAGGMDFSHLGDVPFVAGIPESFLHAICLASVLFGSLTYIGNGPNFMVKAIAESRGIKMPDFFAYMYKFSFIVLLPLFILVAIIFAI